MRRIIPKPAKVRIDFFKGLSVRDIVYLAVCLTIVGVIMLTNIPYKLYIGLAVATVCGALFFFKTDDRLYYEIYEFIRFTVSKKRFVGGEQSAIHAVSGEYIEFKDGYFCGVLKITPMEFFLLREEVQDGLINVFSCVFKNLTDGQKANFVKLDRPIFLDEFIKDLRERSKSGNGSKAERAREFIKRVRTEELQAINTPDNCCYCNAFYFVLYAETKEELDKTLALDLKELSEGGIEAGRIGGAELVGFAKRTVTQIFDERETAELDLSAAEEYIVPGNVSYTKAFAEVDGVRESTFVINRYPTETFNAWATALCNIDYTKVVISVTPIPTDKAVKQIDRSASELEEQYSKTGKISKQSENESHYMTLRYLVEEIGNNNETMLDVCASVTAYDYGKRGAEFRREIRKTLNKLGFRTSAMTFRQAEGYGLSTLNNRFAKPPVFTQGINSSSLAAAFPFVSSQIMERNGVMLGENAAPVIVDFGKRNDNYKNSNIVVLGSVGGGKSYFAKSLFLNLASEGERIFILDPEAEYGILAGNLGGKVIDMGAGGNVINPFAVLTDLSDDNEAAEDLLSAHLTFLEEFFRVTLEGLGSENLELVLSLLPKLYASMGITQATDLKSYTGAYPTFDDFLSFVEKRGKGGKMKEGEQARYRVISMFLEKFASGGRYGFLWNGQTRLKTNADFIVFNFQTLLANANKTIAAAQMLLLTQYLNNELIHNYNKIKSGKKVAPITIAIDEAHVFVDPNNPVALRFMKNTAKRCRKYQGKQVVMTQSVNDFLGDSDLERESKAVLTESQYTFVFPLNASSAADFLRLYDKLDITKEEENEIIDNPRGTAFFIAHQRMRTSFKVLTAPRLRELFETPDLSFEEQTEEIQENS